jgi:hypothetical protein
VVPVSGQPRVNLRPDEGPPPARRATDRYITWGMVNTAFGLWGFVAFLVTIAVAVPWEQLNPGWAVLRTICWVFAVLFAFKAGVMTWVAGGLVRIWMHYRGRRRR